MVSSLSCAEAGGINTHSRRWLHAVSWLRLRPLVLVVACYLNAIAAGASGDNYTFRTLAGSPGIAGTVDGTGSDARFYNVSAIVVDGSGVVYVADTHTIRKITPAGVVSTFAGGTPGNQDGTGTAARFYSPQGIAVDSGSTLYVADQLMNNVRKITPAGVVRQCPRQRGWRGHCR